LLAFGACLCRRTTAPHPNRPDFSTVSATPSGSGTTARAPRLSTSLGSAVSFSSTKRHPDTMGPHEVNAFLTDLASRLRVSASTQNQALSSLLFLYEAVLGRPLGELGDIVRARRPARLPVVLTRAEVSAVLGGLSGSTALMAAVTYGSGLRLLECCQLRVKDIDLERAEVLVRDGKGGRDCVTMPPYPSGRRSRATLPRSGRSTRPISRPGPAASRCPRVCLESTPGRLGSGRGSGCSPQRALTWSLAPVCDGATISTRPYSRRRPRTPSGGPASPSRPRSTRCVTRSRRISSRAATTSGPFKSCWGIVTWPRPWSTPTSLLAAAAASRARSTADVQRQMTR
jgi:Phage integrase, N-terminal SAM-like domain/Phage integrase family